jgi:hypothetical protein
MLKLNNSNINYKQKQNNLKKLKYRSRAKSNIFNNNSYKKDLNLSPLNYFNNKTHHKTTSSSQINEY